MAIVLVLGALCLMAAAITWTTETVGVAQFDCLYRVNRWTGRVVLLVGPQEVCRDEIQANGPGR